MCPVGPCVGAGLWTWGRSGAVAVGAVRGAAAVWQGCALHWALLRCVASRAGEAEAELCCVQRMLLAVAIFPQIRRKLPRVIFKHCIL